MKREEIASEINACKNILDNTDYQILRAIEEIFAADSTMKLLSALASAGKEIVETITLRKQCRARINELEAMTPEEEQTAQTPTLEETQPETNQGEE